MLKNLLSPQMALDVDMESVWWEIFGKSVWNLRVAGDLRRILGGIVAILNFLKLNPVFLMSLLAIYEDCLLICPATSGVIRVLVAYG
jgi:hypothetical protein